MAGAFIPGLQISPRATIRRRRELAVRGTIHVTQGAQVASDAIVAEASREGELRLVRVAEVLGVSPSEAVSRITASQGDMVEEGAVLAELRGLWGLFRTQVTAPLSGTVEFISPATGHIGLRAPPTKIQLSAYIAGTVAAIEPERSVVIETQATFIQGIFGVGGERIGRIRMLGIGGDESVTEQVIPEDCRGCVLVGGRSPTIEALQSAANRGAVGFVTGSIDDGTLRQYVGYDIGIALTGDEPVPMTLIITEGFGAITMNPVVLDLLSRCDGQNASINGATQVRAGASRPEIITAPSAALRDAAATEERSPGLALGSRVRIIRVPFFGAQGTVVALPRELIQIETGAFARVATIALDARQDGAAERVVVPRANIELI
jgi:hypothetical protein